MMCATVAWGSYMFFFSSDSDSESSVTVSKDTESGAAKLNEFVTKLVRKLREKQPTDTDLYIIERAQIKWLKDPFLFSEEHLTATMVQDTAMGKAGATLIVGEYQYSGYLESDDKRLCIINNIEYEEGESLENKRHYVKKIYSNRVIIGLVDTAAITTVPLIEPNTSY